MPERDVTPYTNGGSSARQSWRCETELFVRLRSSESVSHFTSSFLPLNFAAVLLTPDVLLTLDSDRLGAAH